MLQGSKNLKHAFLYHFYKKTDSIKIINIKFYLVKLIETVAKTTSQP